MAVLTRCSAVRPASDQSRNDRTLFVCCSKLHSAPSPAYRSCQSVHPVNSDVADNEKLACVISCSCVLRFPGCSSCLLPQPVALQIEILALRHQVSVLERSVKRARLTALDRWLWAWLSHHWSAWRARIRLVKPATVIAWQRKEFRLFWTWNYSHGRPGRPALALEVRQLIRRMSRDNPLWGAPKIHGELLKLGIDVSESSVSKYLVLRKGPPSQYWKTFLENHVRSLVSADFLTVSTMRFPDSLRLSGAGTLAPPHSALCGHCSSDRGVDGTATT